MNLFEKKRRSPIVKEFRMRWKIILLLYDGFQKRIEYPSSKREESNRNEKKTSGFYSVLLWLGIRI